MLFKVFDGVLAHGVDALCVEIHNLVPLCLLQLVEGCAAVLAGIVDEYVYASPLGFHIAEKLLYGLVVAQVDDSAHDLVIGVDLLQGGHGFFSGLLIVTEETHFDTFCQEFLHSGKTYAPASAAYDGDLAFQFFVHFSFLLSCFYFKK